MIRLDAIAYVWKIPGTSCIHLPQTHEVVKLMRDLLEEVVPGVVLLTETNVPQWENVSYFGDVGEKEGLGCGAFAVEPRKISGSLPVGHPSGQGNA